MAVDHLDVIGSEGARILAAYRSNPDGHVPWSDRWTVRSVARHVAGSHHAVALILAERPTADFEQAAAMPGSRRESPSSPTGSPPTPGGCFTHACTAPPTAVCWAPHPMVTGTAEYWTQRIAYDTLVHRWDAEAGAGIAGPAMEPGTAADAVEEVLNVGLRVTRAMAAPAGARHLPCVHRCPPGVVPRSCPGRPPHDPHRADRRRRDAPRDSRGPAAVAVGAHRHRRRRDRGRRRSLGGDPADRTPAHGMTSRVRRA